MKGFDAATLKPSTINFGVNGTEATPIDVGQRDVNGDGRVDQVLCFEIQDTRMNAAIHRPLSPTTSVMAFRLQV
jgi:hypothetical protein